MQIIKPIALILLSSLLFSCGGGGGGNTAPTDPNQIFSLSKLQSAAVGIVYNTQLTGHDSYAINYSGYLLAQNRAQAMLNGVLVTPQDVQIYIQGGGQSITTNSTYYTDTSGNLISLTVQTTGVTCTPVTPDKIPTLVKIGDIGDLSTLVCTDNTTEQRSWRVQDAGNGRILLITTNITKTQANTLVTQGDETYTIDINGDIVAYKVGIINFGSGPSLWLNSI